MLSWRQMVEIWRLHKYTVAQDDDKIDDKIDDIIEDKIDDKIEDKIDDKIEVKIDDKIVDIREVRLEPAGMTMLWLVGQDWECISKPSPES